MYKNEYRFLLHLFGWCDKIFVPAEVQEVPKGARRDTNKRKAVGLLFPKKGGLAYAYLCYVSSVRDYRADQTDEKKQQPPLCQVTVVRHFV